MKKLISILLLGIFMLTSAAAQPNNSDKSLWKIAKKTAKELKKEGWKVDGSMPMENLLFNHYKKINNNEEFQEIIGNVIGNTSVTTMNQAQQWAATQVAVTYAKSAGASIKGRMNAEIGAGLGGSSSADFFYEAYESSVEKEIKGELKKSFSLYREKNGGGIDYKAYYVVNAEGAHNARMRALKMTMEESDFARTNAERISQFINEGFDIEN